MQTSLSRFAAIFLASAALSAAQTSSATRIYTIPDGLRYYVDGEMYHGPARPVWTAGSKHVLTTDKEQDTGVLKTRYAFQAWHAKGGDLGGPTVEVVSDPVYPEYWATFTTEYALMLQSFALCADESMCASPGTVLINDAPFTQSAELYFAEGSVVRLVAKAAPGFVFTGWETGTNQVVQGPVNTVKLNSPAIVRPHFQPARRIHILTEPAGLEVFADRARVPTPATVEWAPGTTHAIGVPSPQQTQTSTWWVFTGWSDHGAANHNFTVPADSTGDITLTATFATGTTTDLRTSPAGLSLKIDGRDNWPGYAFMWAPGETHRIEAPAQQTDEQNRVWNFDSWSNGGSRAQDYTVPADAPNGYTRLTANYAPVGHLVVTSAFAGVTIQVDGADCGTPCDLQRPVGTTLHLHAPASLPLGDQARADFDGWPGSGSTATDWTVTLGADAVTPRLTYHIMNHLTMASDPADGASFRAQPESPDGYYDAQSTVVVSVKAQPGFRFKQWGGDAAGSAPLANVAMNTPRLVQAMFDRVPYIAPAGVANAAGATPEKGVAAGSIVSIFGASFTTETIVGPDAPLSQALGCVTVRLSGRMLPLFFVSPSQINVQMPDDLAPGDQTLTVSCQGMPDVKGTFTLVRNAPGLFQDADGAGVVLHEDGSLVSGSSPARRGELLTVYGTGFGPAARPRPFGFPVPADPSYPLADTASVISGDAEIAAEAAFAAPGRIGLDVAQFRLTDGIPSGTAQIRVRVNGKDSNTVTVAVE